MKLTLVCPLLCIMSHMRTRIDIETQTFVRFWLVVIGFALAFFAIRMASTALLIIGIALFLALALNGPVNRIYRELPGRSRVGATALAYIAVLAVLGAVLFLVVPPIVQQTAVFLQKAPAVVESALDQSSGLKALVDEYGLQPQVDSALDSVQSSAAGWAGNVGENIISGIGSVFSFFAALILVLVLTFLMLVEGPGWMRRVWGLYRDKDQMIQHKRVVGKIYSVFSGYVTGQLLVSAIGALFAGLAVFVISLIFPNVAGSLAFPTAAVTFVLSLVPMFGATIAGTIITLLIALNNIPAAITYAIFFIIYQQVENNFISPHIQSKKLELSALAVLVAATIGIYMFGIVGGIIAIPIAGSLRVLFDEYNQSRSRAERASRRLAAGK
ncbi:hypothetical protein B7Y94_01320 [Candidatus Saccharibacteria bacterium 32-49-12]|nr:MAG: hypothetical protein B7Y94_01320 [Candidatus Saccharibacteria bacterium 32-49-12]